MKCKTFIEEDQAVWAHLEDGQLSLRIYLEEFNPEDSPVDQAIQSWQNTEDDTNTLLELRFTLSSVLDLMEDIHNVRYTDGNPPVPVKPLLISQKAKPLWQALRAEMVSAIERIDGIEYD